MCGNLERFNTVDFIAVWIVCILDITATSGKSQWALWQRWEEREVDTHPDERGRCGHLDANEKSWKSGVPDDLIPAVEHLRESSDEVHFECGRTTLLFCYAVLHHNETPDDPDGEFSRHLLQKIKGVAAAREYRELLRIGTPPAVFKAYYDMYVNAVSTQALEDFEQLIEIGRANQPLLDAPFVEWAETQTNHLIRSQVHRIRFWIKQVCSGPVYDSKKWQAPSLIIMRPSGDRPYEADKTWELNDPEISAHWLKLFQDDYVLRLERKIHTAAGETALALAKQPMPPQRGPADPVGLSPNREDSAKGRSAPAKHATSNAVRREAGKRETEAKYRRWQAAYRKLKKTHKGRSGVWYSQQIARLAIADGRNPETIRKHMK